MKLSILIQIGLLTIGIKSQETCICPEGKYFDKSNVKYITPDPSTENCASYNKNTDGKIICNQCIEGYYLDSQKNCQKPKDITNCRIYTGKNSCSVCEDGYYASYDMTFCISNPSSKDDGIIDNCIVYEASNGRKPNCNKCDSSYYLQNDKQCSALIQLDENCIKAEQIAEKFVCSECDSGNYLIKDHKCSENPTTKEEGLIENCQHYFLGDEDKVACKQCKEGMVLKDVDGKECVNVEQGVENCDLYSFNDSDGEIYCMGCQINSFPSQKSGFYVEKCTKCPSLIGEGSILHFCGILLLILSLLF